MAISGITTSMPSAAPASKAATAAGAAQAKVQAQQQAQAAKALQAQQAAAAKALAAQKAQQLKADQAAKQQAAKAQAAAQALAAKQLKESQAAQVAAAKAQAAQAAKAAKEAQAVKAAAEKQAKIAPKAPEKPTVTPVITPPAPEAVKPSVAAIKPTVAPTPPVAASNATGFVANGGEVVVDIKASESGYNNKIFWSSDNFQTKQYLGIDNQTGTYNLGKIAAGTRIDFGIDNGVGQFFRTGDAKTNADGLEHARFSAVDGGAVIGFEDLYGGGDKDFNDAIIGVKNLAPTVPATGDEPASNNRSGLGDGTNPGQGAGRDNATNTGTLNPNKSAAYNTAAVVTGLINTAA